MGLIRSVKDVGRRLGVGDTQPAQPGPDAQQAAALVRLVGNVQGGRPGGRPAAGGPAGAGGPLLQREAGGHALEDRGGRK